jgi:hypothetical protein
MPAALLARFDALAAQETEAPPAHAGQGIRNIGSGA